MIKPLENKRLLLRRIFCLILPLSFLMPFITITGCNTKKVTTYYGFDLFSQSSGWLYLLPIVFVLILFIISFINRQISSELKIFLLSWEAIAGAICGFIIIALPEFQFLFDAAKPEAGQILCAVSIIFIYFENLLQLIPSEIQYYKETKTDNEKKFSPLQFLNFFICLAGFLFPISFVIIDGDFMTAIMTFIFLFLPFCSGQWMVISAIGNKEKWSRIWTGFLASCLLVVVILIIVLL